MRNISTEKFYTAIAASSLSLSVNLSCAGEILSLYNNGTSNVLEALAPLKTRARIYQASQSANLVLKG